MKNIIDILDQHRQLPRRLNADKLIIEHIQRAVVPTVQLDASQEGHLGRCIDVGPGAMEPIHYATFLTNWIHGCHSARSV